MQERVGDHRHQRVSMQTDPRSAFEMVEPELVLHLLVRLLADPACFDRRRERFERRVRRQTRQVMFPLPVGSVLADQPDLFAGHVLVAHVADALGWTVGDAHAQRCKPGPQPSLGSPAPADHPPRRVAEDRVRRNRLGIGNVVETLAPACCRRKHQDHVCGIDLLVARDADRPGEPALAQRLPKGGAQPIPGIGEHAAEPYACRVQPVDLLDRDSGLAPERPVLVGHPSAGHPVRVICPALGEEQAERRRHRHLAAGERQRHQCLAIRVLAERGGILRGHADRMDAFLGQGGVVDHQHGVRAADQAIRLYEQCGLQGRAVPTAGDDEVMQPVVFARDEPLGHRLHALAVARTDQTRHVERAHPSPLGVAQPIEKGLQPSLELCRPVVLRRGHGRPAETDLL